MTQRVEASELRQFIEKIERLEAEKQEAADEIKQVYSRASGSGYDAKAMRKLVARRKRDRNDVAEEDAVLEMYEQAIGGLE